MRTPVSGGHRLPLPSGHVCWSYDDPAVFDARAAEFLAVGLAAGERVTYVGVRRPQVVFDRLREAAGTAGDPFARGAAGMVSVGDRYAERTVEPSAQVAAYAAATAQAQDAGYTGLRVVADATPLVDTPQRLDAFARYEHLVDRYMRTRPFTAMCAYHRGTLGDRAIAELACLHPQTNADVLFSLHGVPPEAGVAGLAGELDPSNHDLFDQALRRADLRPVDGLLPLRAEHLRFVDHRSLLRLDDYACARNATVVLDGAAPVAAHLVELLGLDRVRVVAGASARSSEARR